MLIVISQWYLALLAIGAVGYAVLHKLGLNSDQAWAGGRVVGLSLIVFLPWWFGHTALEQWQSTSIAISGLSVLVALISMGRSGINLRRIAAAELMFLIGFLVVLVIRLDRPEILMTEKLMDFGLLNSLLRPGQFPPRDFWLGGETLEYYYYGILVWIVPLKIINADPAVAYNLIIATIGGSIATLSWSVGKSLTLRTSGGLLTAFFCLAAGTLDGIRQLAIFRDLHAVDIWKSTRTAEGNITEFPLFTLWLGDLHPHLLVMPLTLVLLLLALHISRTAPTAANVTFLSITAGLIMAVNPWSYPPALIISAAIITLSRYETDQALRAYFLFMVMILLITILSALAVLPFWVSYQAPAQGLGLVSQGSTFSDLLFYAGALLLPVVCSLYCLPKQYNRSDDNANTQRLLITAAIVVLAVLTARPVPVFLAAILLCLIWIHQSVSEYRYRIAMIFAAMGLFLLLVPELIYVKDVYDQAYYRLNTVFKFYFQAWFYLSIAVPVLLYRMAVQSYRRLFILLILVVALVHPVSLIARFDRENTGLDGLSWMDHGDRAIVGFLAAVDSDAMILERVGEAYSDAARISSVSGLSSYLGWVNHQLVWRGESIRAELDRRTQIADRIYTSGDVDLIQTLAQQEGIDYLIVGSLEREHYSETMLTAVAGSGKLVFSYDHYYVVKMQ